MSTRKQKWVGAGAAVVVLAMFGSCIDDSSRDTETKHAEPNSSARTTMATTSTVLVKDQAVWAGTVLAHEQSFRVLRTTINVDGETKVVKLAHVGAVSCSGSLDVSGPAAIARLTELAPVGSSISVVRGVGQSSIDRDGKFTDEGFLQIQDAPVGAVTASPGATTTSPTSSSTPSSSTAGPSSSTTTATATPVTEVPSGTMLNEVLIAEGLATLQHPDIDLSVLARKPVQEQMTSAFDAVRRGTNLTYFPRLFTAYQSAWDNRVGFQADCRAEDDERVVRKQQSDELDRIRRGPDGIRGTSDDDHQLWKFNENGELYVETPPAATGGGRSLGGFGGGGRCRSRWC